MKPAEEVAREFFGCHRRDDEECPHDDACGEVSGTVWGCTALAALLTAERSAAREEERERCAKVADVYTVTGKPCGHGTNIAAAIRAGGAK